MSSRADFNPGQANLAHVEKQGEDWTLVLVKELRHAPDKVWDALTDPVQLREWAPFDADSNLGTAGAKVKLATVGAPAEHVTETTVGRADEPRLLEYKWGDHDMRWELEADGQGTRLTLRTRIPRGFIAMGAAGWQVCFGVLGLFLAGDPVGRIVADDAMRFGDWQRLNKEYSEQFGVEPVSW